MKSGKVTMEIKRLKALATEIFKTVKNLNPNYMKNIFTPKLHPKLRPNDILIKHHNTIKYGAKSLKALGPRYGTNYQVTLNQRHLIPHLRNIRQRRTAMYFNVFTDVLARI